MKRPFKHSRLVPLLCSLVLFPVPLLLAEPPAAAVMAFRAYARTIETRLAQQHRSAEGFLAPTEPGGDARLRRGELILERVATPPGDLAGAMLHHWRGTAFAPGAKAADFARLIRDFNSYPAHFAPQVLQAKVTAQEGDRMTAFLRVRQHHVITVVMDATYDVAMGRLDAEHGYSLSKSTRMSEVEGAGTASERTLSGSEEHGFLWRLNTYWSYEERDGGLYLQIEAVSLTRSVPRGLGWVVRPYVESIPRESLEFTLRSACNAVRKP